MTTTIEKILGNKPSSDEIKAEFDKRDLSLDSANIILVCETEKPWGYEYVVHGHQSTTSQSYQDAAMKYLIAINEIESR